MENYSYTSYPESGDSSPRSREIDFDNPPWDDPNQPLPPNYKVKFMCSYGGKIHPRPHDNQLAYIGGETKILSVERSIKYSNLISKLGSLCDLDAITFKYQLPGEDLDALISVTTDDDLEHMMHEYDRLYKASPKPARLRLFVFPGNPDQNRRSFGSDDVRSEKERFVEALNSGPVQTVIVPPNSAPGNADFLFGLEKGPPPPPQVAVKDPEIPHHEMFGSDPIQKHIQDLQRLQLEEQQNHLLRKRNDDNYSAPFAGGGGGAEYYMPKTSVAVQGTLPPKMGYWAAAEKQLHAPPPASSLGTEQQPVYMIPATAAGAYHAPPMVRPMATPQQGYYAVQRMPPEAYHVPPPVHTVATGQPTAAAQYGMVRPSEAGYAPMAAAYDGGVGRPVYYAPPPPQAQQQQYQQHAPPQQQQYQQHAPPLAAVSSDIRAPPPVAVMNQDPGKVVANPKVTQTSV